jgi:hypothetical protein
MTRRDELRERMARLAFINQNEWVHLKPLQTVKLSMPQL